MAREAHKVCASGYTRRERLADGCVHLVGIAASLAAAVTLLVVSIANALPALPALSLGVYGAGMVAVFWCSAAYHLSRAGRVKAILGRFDHAAIYFKIAGTYTPFALVPLGSSVGPALLALVWSITIVGALAKLLWPDRLVVASYVLYLSQGWAVLMAWSPLSDAVSTRVLALLIAGGSLYTLGVAFHLWRKLRFHKAIWHALVLLASACHFAAVMDCIALGGRA